LDESHGDDFLTPKSRKGHEASAYLTYIIDNYYLLAPYTIFIHGREDQWHNDVAGPHTRNVIANLRYELAMHKPTGMSEHNAPGFPSGY
jgi:hypothetical protein